MSFLNRVAPTAYRLPVLLCSIVYASLGWAEIDQVHVVLNEDMSLVRSLLIFLSAAAIGISLTILSGYHGSYGRRELFIIDAIVAPLPLVSIWSVTSGPMARSLFLLIAFVLLIEIVLWAWIRLRVKERWGRAFFLMLGAATWAAILASLYSSPVEFPRAAGSLFFVVVFVGLLFLALQLAISYPVVGIPAIALAAVVFVSNERDYDLRIEEFTNHDKFDDGKESFRSPVSIQDAFDIWLASRNDLSKYKTAGKPYPVFLIAAEGGGGYAAAHAYTFLRKMQDRCPNFAQHVFAITGVSGGAVGNALFWSSLEDEFNPRDLMGCGGEVDVSNEIRVLAQDNLAPVVGVMLFRDFLNKILFGILPGPNRSEALVYSLSGSRDLGSDLNPFYYNHYWRELEGGERRLVGGPAIVPVATNLVSGKPYIFAPFEINDLRNGFEQSLCDLCDLSWIGPDEVGIRLFDSGFYDVAVASASFPYVTPSLALPSVYGGRVGLVDGGYIDNSSTEVLLEIAKALHSPNRFFDGAAPGHISFPANADMELETRDCYGPSMFGGGMSISAIPKPYENSGASVQETEIGGGDVDNCSASVEFITITIRSEPTRDRFIGQQSFFLDPVAALLNGRARRAELARLRLYDWQCAAGAICPRQVGAGIDVGFLDSVIRPQDVDLPLGWKMPLAGLLSMSNIVSPEPDAVIEIPLDSSMGLRGIIEWQNDVFASVSENPYSVSVIVSALTP